MATTISFRDGNSGFQVGINNGSITTELHLPPGIGDDILCLRELLLSNPEVEKKRIGKQRVVYSMIPFPGFLKTVSSNFGDKAVIISCSG